MNYSAIITDDGRVLISHSGRQIVVLAGLEARKVIDRLARTEGGDAEQMILAKATGNFKRGTER
jgi:hypothetical protein